MKFRVTEYGIECKPETEFEKELCRKMQDEGCEFGEFRRHSTNDAASFMLVHRDFRVTVTYDDE